MLSLRPPSLRRDVPAVAGRPVLNPELEYINF
jgi:hypothetical protein